jgi:hypothetical protein
MNQIIQLPSSAAAAQVAQGHARRGGAIRTNGVYVVYTTPEETVAAIRAASDFANAIGARVTLMHFRVVPYALPVDAPCGISPIETDAFVNRLASEGLEVRRRVYLCREERPAIRRALKRASLVFVGGHRRWWPTPSERRRRELEAAGHFVVIVDPSAVKERAHA